MKKASAVLAVSALAVLGLAACGGSSNDNSRRRRPPHPPRPRHDTSGRWWRRRLDGRHLHTVRSDLAFDQKDATAKAGNVTIDFDNKQSLQHDVAVADSSGKVLGQTDLVSSGTANTTVDLQPGTYTFYCTVPGHKEAAWKER